MVESIYEYESPVGRLVVACDDGGVTGLWMEGQKYYGQTLSRGAVRRRTSLFDETAAWLDGYFAGEVREWRLPLAPVGSDFRQMVWRILLDIPYGETTTYGGIAQRVAEMTGKASFSAQAVGGAVGHNPISIIIPCHRVLGSDGTLTGYAGGVEKKAWLLRLEGALPNVLFHP